MIEYWYIKEDLSGVGHGNCNIKNLQNHDVDYIRDHNFYATEYSAKVACAEKVYKLNNYTNKMKITNIVKKILDVDTRTLVKAGFINGDLALTDEGVSELVGLIFLEKKNELVKVAQEKLYEKVG